MNIPFWMVPGAWGLKGKSRDIAQAEYELRGYDLEVRLAELNHQDDPVALARNILDIDLKYKKIEQYAYDLSKSTLNKEGVAADVAKLEVELKHERVTPQEYERKKADLLGEPWMAMPKISWDPINPSKTYFELDYNDHFLKFLRDNAYVGSDEECINRWLNDVCLSVLDEMGQPEPELVSTVRKIRLPDGKTEHS
jgi:hypothetical protein